jgi:putative nucleotidyltransferase with HDIG domain
LTSELDFDNTDSQIETPEIVDGWATVKIETFRNVTRDIGFDVFLKLSEENYAHVFSKSTGLDYKRLAHYMSKGVTHLWVKGDDLHAYMEFISKPAHAIFVDPQTPQEKKIATLLNMTEQNLAELFTQISVNDEAAKSTRQVIENYVQLMTTEPQTLAVILKLVSHGEYLYYHAIAVSIFSMFIAKASGQLNKEMLEIVAMGGFLHDIGCSQIPQDILNSTHELTPQQQAVMRKHPRIGMKMLEKSRIIPKEVRYIIYQHHECPNGQGYPNGLRGSAIYMPARVVALADEFSELISHRPGRKAYPVDQALKILEQEASAGKYDQTLVRLLIGVLHREASSKAA